MMTVGNYPLGYDLSLLQTIYHKPTKLPDGSWTPDVLDMIIKDNITGDKFLETIEEPEYTYYMVKPEIYVKHNLHYCEKEKCTPVTVPFRRLLKSIAENCGQTAFYYSNCENGNYSNNNTLHMIPRVLGSDIDIEDHYRFKFGESYQNRFVNPTKGYFDIEVDTRTMKGDFVEPGECPINAVSFIDDASQQVYVFLLRDTKNPLCLEFEKIMDTDALKQELYDFVIGAVGGVEKAMKYRVNTLKYNFMMFGDERDLIKTLFKVINECRPDFMLAWNMSFDVPYIIARCKSLKMSAPEVMCDKDFKYKECRYYIDERNYNEYAERNDFCKISSYSVYLDQMIHFASRRKGQSAIPNFKLDSIGEMTVGVKKLDYHHICQNLEDLPQCDYKTFVFYNIMDTIVQYCIENKVNDIGNVYNNALLNNTKYSKIYRQTVYLKNRAFKSYWRKGFIMGNNVNKETPKEKFPGAWVSNPVLANDYSKIRVCGKPISVYDNLNDFDYKALYPSITSELNMSPNTIIAHLVIPTQVFSGENRFGREDYKYKREGQFMEDLQSHQWLTFFHRWFNLASYSEMYDDFIEYYTCVIRPIGQLDLHAPDGKRYAFTKVTHEERYGSPFIRVEEEYKSQMVYPHKVYDYLLGESNLSQVYDRIQSRGDNCYNRNLVEVRSNVV